MKKQLLYSWLLAMLFCITGASNAWGESSQVCSWSRSGSSDSYTSGFTFTATASGKSGYYQDASSGVGAITLYHTSTKLFSSTPSTITFTAKVGGGSNNKDLSTPVYVCLVDKDGNDITGTSTSVTSKITTSSGDTYNISLDATKGKDAYGVKIYHTKESGYNVRYFSFSVSYEEAAPSYTITGVSSNNTHGTVSVDGNVITATPAEGYRISTSSAYTITSGEANVSNVAQDDNEFTVTASGDCTIQINFEAIPSHTITISTPTGGTLTVKNGDDNVSSGSGVREGTVLTIVPEADNSHRFNKWTATVGGTPTNYTDVFSYTVPSGDVTFSATFDEVVKYAVNWNVNGNVTTEYYEENEAITFPSDPADVNGKTFVGWVAEAIEETTNDAPTFVTSATMGNSNVTYYACFAAAEGSSETKKDALTSSVTGITISSYSNFSNKSVSSGSSAKYAGNCAGSNSYIQLRTSSNTGLVSTTSGGIAKKVTVAWASNTDRALQVYGSNTAYTGLSDIFDDNKKGTLLGTLTYGSDTELTITGNYAYIGIKPDSGKSGASQLASITIDWEVSNISYSDYCTTVAAAVPVSSVSVDATASVNVGETTTLTATVLPNNATNKNVTWESNDEDVATVDENGVVTGVAAGTTTITVTSVADNTKTATCTVTVTTVAVTGVSVDATASVNVGETTTLTATISPNNATNKNVTWESGNTSIATVDANGVVTGVAAGTATITVTSVADNTKTASCTVTVSVVPGTAARPYTVAEAIDAINNGGNVTDVYVRGIVCTGGSSLSSGALNYWISDDGTETDKFEIYKGKGISNADFTSTDDIQVGDIVVVCGNITLYNSTTYEFSAGSQLVSRTEKPASDLAKTSDIVLDYLNNNTTADVTDYITSSSTGAYTFTVGDGTIIENADEIISALAVGTTTVTVNQAATLSYKAGSVVINVTVQDTRTAATTIPAINISTLTEGAADGTIEVVNPVKADEGATFSFASSNEDVLLIIDDAYTVGKVGTATVTVTATPSNTNLYKPVVANFDVTVEVATKTDNAILLDAASGSTVYGTQKSVDYEVEDGYDGVMGYSINNSAIADVAIGASAITFTPKAVGTAIITISAPATPTFNAAEDVTYTLTVTAPAGKITAAAGPVTVFTETFDDSTGGPLSTWGGSEANGTLTTDVSGWTNVSGAGAGSCAKFGAGKTAGSATTPSITVENGGTYQLSFKAAPWSTESSTITVTVSGGTINGNASATTSTMSTQQWNDYNYDIVATSASMTIAFSASSNRFFLDEVNVAKPGVAITATLNASGYASFCSEYPLDFSDYATADYSAWQVTGTSGTTITFSKIKGKVKGGTGILLKGEAGAIVTLKSADSDNTLSSNMLVGTTAPTYVTTVNGDYTNFGLSGDKFKKINTGVVRVNKAYLPILTANVPNAEARLTFIFEDEETTGIKSIDNGQLIMDNGAVYDLQGRKVQNPKRGLYIINGKKVVIK